jgi:O-antigen/teichoic acid export membrane protein
MSSFLAPVLMLSSGTALAQLVNVGVLPALTRIYTPAEFGVLALYLALVAVLSSVNTGRFEYAVLVSETHDDAWGCVFGTLGLATVSSALLLIVLLAVAWLGWFALDPMLALCVAAGLWLQGTYQAFYFWANRMKRYGRMTRTRVWGALTMALVSVTLGLLGFGAYGLVAGSLAGVAVNAVGLTRAAWREARPPRPQVSIVARLVRRYRRYPAFLVPSGLMQRLSAQLHVLMMNAAFGATVVGGVGLYQRVVSVPATTIGNAIGDVFKQQSAELLQRDGECTALVGATTLRLAVVAVPIFLVLELWAPSIFAWVFGEAWRFAGEYARPLAWIFVVGFVVSPVTALLLVAEKQKYDLYLQMFSLALVAAALGVGWWQRDAMLTLWLYAGAYVVKYAVEMFLTWSIAAARPFVSERVAP